MGNIDNPGAGAHPNPEHWDWLVGLGSFLEDLLKYLLGSTTKA